MSYSAPHQQGFNIVGGIAPISNEIVEIPSSFTPKGGDEGRTLGLGCGSPGIGAVGIYSLTVPMLRGEGFLTEGNNLKINGAVVATLKRSRTLFGSYINPSGIL